MIVPLVLQDLPESDTLESSISLSTTSGSSSHCSSSSKTSSLEAMLSDGGDERMGNGALVMTSTKESVSVVGA